MKQLLVITVLLTIAACGDSGDKASSTADSTKSSPAKQSRLANYLADDKVCDLLSDAYLTELSGGDVEIEKRSSSYRENYSCSYSWPRADAAEREKKMLSNIMSSMRGDGPKLSLRDRSIEHEVSISVQKSSRKADNFVPRKLSEEQIEAQIAAAKKRAAEKLTDEQKSIAGDAANDMMERLLRRNNENVTVTGIGDAAFWSDLATGSLQVLDGNVQLNISPLIADSKSADLENAKKIASTLLK